MKLSLSEVLMIDIQKRVYISKIRREVGVRFVFIHHYFSFENIISIDAYQRLFVIYENRQ